MLIIPAHLVGVVEHAIERELAADRALPEGMLTPREREAEPMAVLIVSLGQATLLLDASKSGERASGGSLIPPVVDPAHRNVRGARSLGGLQTPSPTFVRPLGAS